jgi:hypothetical protein
MEVQEMIPKPDDLNTDFLVAKYRAAISEWKEASAFNLNFHPEYDYVQPKQDGWWVVIVLQGGCYYMVTSGAEARWRYELPEAYRSCTGILIGEYMYGTSWAQEEDRLGTIVLHDVVHFSDGKDIRFDARAVTEHKEVISKGHAYGTRLMFLEENANLLCSLFPKTSIIQTYSRANAKELWDTLPDYEGIVLKKSSSYLREKNAFVKVKHVFTMDYVCAAIVEGSGRLKGRMGSIAGALYQKEKLVAVVAVGGGFSDAERLEIWQNKEEYLYKTFEAEGKKLFKKVTLRHPVFKRWRPDKLPSLCRWPE